MDCENAKEFISALYDNENVPAEVKEHLNWCMDCQEMFQSFADIGAEIQALARRSSIGYKT